MKNCLIIDDNHPKDEIGILEKKGNGEIKCHYFNPTENKYFRKEIINGTTELIIDRELVLEGLKEKFDGKQSIDLIASDFDFGDKGGTDGLTLLQYLKENWRGKIPSVIYSTLSATIKENLQREIEKVKDNKDELTTFLESYYDNHPDHTIDKKEFTDSIIAFLKQNKFSMTNRLAEKLLEFPEMEFDNIFPQFKNYKLGGLAKMIQKDNNNSYAFKNEFLERAVAHFIFLKE